MLYGACACVMWYCAGVWFLCTDLVLSGEFVLVFCGHVVLYNLTGSCAGAMGACVGVAVLCWCS